MKKLNVYQVDSFTKEKFKGNPAGVVVNADGLTDKQMLLIARELNNSETAFLISPENDDYDWEVRYFTPKTEVPTCGHATIAAMYVKAFEENLTSCSLRIKTKIGILPIEILKGKNDFQVIMTQGSFELGPVFDDRTVQQLMKALGIAYSDLDRKCPVQVASTGHSKVMTGIKSREKLNRLTPDFYALTRLSKQIRCNGFFVFTFDTGEKDILTCGRMFAPAIGINEDPVTGNANGPLGGYLIRNGIIKNHKNYFEFRGKQGEAIERPGIVTVRVRLDNNGPSAIQIMGDAVVIFRTEVTI